LEAEQDQAEEVEDEELAAMVAGRGLHSFTFQLDVSAFCEIGGAFKGCLGGG
jgi:hypothetical protein